jgi:DNA-binding SARP family transcriptional activator/tetratricopeptide (TPR) repeat protein
MGGPDYLLRFQVLGPLRVWRQAEPVDLGPVQRRVVLAVLLLNANQPLGRQQLIDAVWGEAAPRWAVNLLQRDMSGLRRALEPERTERSAPSCLQWTDAGYRLDLSHSSLDLATFGELVERARKARCGKDAEAARLLSTALDLWHGPVCSGLRSPLLDAERDRLSEKRIGVHEDRIELDLIVGTQRDLVDELRRLVSEHPFRERLWELLMLALYRLGQPADALAAYQRARRTLRVELGIEPSASLQRLQRQILTREPALLGSSIAAATATVARPDRAEPPPPAQLPHALTDFVGRDEEVVQLDQSIQTNGGAPTLIITAIVGTAGLGKTALALHWAHRVKERFPDGQLYMDLRGFDPSAQPVPPAVAMRGFLEALGVSPDQIPPDLPGQASMYRSLLATRRILVVLDNAMDAQQVRPLLPGSSSCVVLVTSRDQLAGLVAVDGARTLPLDVLSTAVSRRLIARRLGEARVAAESAAVDSIIQSCGQLPLALSIVAARASINPWFSLAQLADELEAASGTLDQFDGGEQAVDVRAVFSWSYQGLTEQVAQLFRQLALTPGPDVSTAATASLAAMTVGEICPLLSQLARANLIMERIPGRFLLHDLLRAYAMELALSIDSSNERQAAKLRLLDHYLHTAFHADKLLNTFRDDPIELDPAVAGVNVERFQDHRAALGWFVAERAALLAATTRAAEDGFYAHAWRLVWTQAQFLELEGYRHESATVHEIGVRAAEQLAEVGPQAVSHAGLAHVFAWIERDGDATMHLVRALRLYEKLGDVTGMAHAHRTLALVFDRQGDYQQGLRHAEQALQLFAQDGHRSGEARALNAVGWFHYRLGEPAVALRFCQRALELQGEIGARNDQADTLDSLGRAHHQLGHYEQAIRCHEDSMELYKEVGHRYHEADEYVLIGEVHLAARRIELTRAAWQHAISILDDVGHPDADRVRTKLAALQNGESNLADVDDFAEGTRQRSTVSGTIDCA